VGPSNPIQALAAVRAPAASAVPGLICAYQFGTDGAARPLPVDGPIDGSGEGWLWLHFSFADQRSRAWLAAAPGLAAPARELLVGTDTHLQLHLDPGGMSGVLSDLLHEFGSTPASDQTCDLRFAMTERLMVTGRLHPLRSIEALRRTIQNGRRLPTPLALLETLIGDIAAEIDAAMDEIIAGMDKVEDEILDDELHDERVVLGRLRRRTVALHRRLAGLQSLFRRIDQRDGAMAISPDLQIVVERLCQRLTALDQELRDVRDRGRLLQEELTAQLATVTNRHLHALSILTAVLLPPSVVVGFFGMNTKDLPLANTEGGAWWALGICAVSGLVVYVLLRKAPELLRRAGIVD